MDSFEINKIIASILLVALLIIGISKISNIIFKVDKLDSSAYKVELPDDGAKQISEENTMKADDKVDISALMALGDIAHVKRFLKNVQLVIQLRPVEVIKSDQHYIMW